MQEKRLSKYLFIHEERMYYKEDIIHALQKSGILEGDTIFVHSQLKYLGKINPQISREEYLEEFICALCDAVGKTGNIIMPTFSYSFCKHELFDKDTTSSTVGILTEKFRKHKDVLRSSDAIFSVVVYGPEKEFFTDTGNDCFGKNSIFEKMHQRKGKFVFIGDRFDITYMHYVEQALHVSYRYIKIFNGTVRDHGQLTETHFKYNVRSLDENIEYDLEGIAQLLMNSGVMHIAQLGCSKIRVVQAIDAFDVLSEEIKKDQFVLLENPPSNKNGALMYDLMKELFPICRSLTGNGVRETLRILQKHIPLKIHEIPTGTQVFDWTVPKEWNIRDAYIMDSSGNKIVDFKKNNLHVVGYSIPVNKKIPLSELNNHLYSLENQPDAVPYITSYYKERWGFCIEHSKRKELKEGIYTVVIDSTLADGNLTYGELIIPGKSSKEIFLSTYICHPSMANNELSGPVLITFLAKWILSQRRKYTYRIIFIPETIGSITYLSKNLDEMKKNIIAGFNVSCVGDDGDFSYIPSRNGETLSDRAVLNVLKFKNVNLKKYSYLDRASDERQYNAPGIDLPICCLLKSKYESYPQYHTSLDNLDFVSPKGMYESYTLYIDCLDLIERNEKYQLTCLGEPQLGKRGLYPDVSTKTSFQQVKKMVDFIAYADGCSDLIEISEKIQVPVWELYPIIEKLIDVNLLKEIL